MASVTWRFLVSDPEFGAELACVYMYMCTARRQHVVLLGHTSLETGGVSMRSDTSQDFAEETHVTSGVLQNAPLVSAILQLASGRTSAYSLPGSMSKGAGSFFLHVPSSHPVSLRACGHSLNESRTLKDGLFPLLVIVHGSRRDAEKTRDRWSDFAERHQIVVLCPLFPADLKVSVHHGCQ